MEIQVCVRGIFILKKKHVEANTKQYFHALLALSIEI
jgi:hypothetical protein